MIGARAALQHIVARIAKQAVIAAQALNDVVA